MENVRDRERIGRFFVDMKFFEDTQLTFEEKLKPFNQILVLDAKTNFINYTVEYYAISPLFRKVNQGEVIPTYQCILSKKDEESEIEYSWEEIKQA